MSKLIGTNPNQVPSNADLGTAAFMDKKDFLLSKGSEMSAIDAVMPKTALDVFVYDTTKDSDGGAWRKRTQHTSWYNEKLNTTTRGSRKEFPAVAVIVVESNKVTIYDGDDPIMPMWMVFTQIGGWNSSLIVGTGNTSTGMLNARLLVGTAPNIQGLMDIDFILDRGQSHLTNGLYGGVDTAPLSLRNTSGHTFSTGTALGHPSLDIVSNAVNDIAMTVLPNAPIDSATGLPIPTIAVATNGGVSVIKDNGSVVDITNTQDSSTFNFCQDVHFRSDGGLVWSADSTGNSAAPRFIQVLHTIPSADFSHSSVASSSNIDEFYSRSTTSQGDFKFLSANGIKALQNSTGRTNVGTVDGLSSFAYNKTTPEEGLGNYITSDYNTGYMVGDIKLATLSDTDTANAVGTDFVTNGNFSSSDLSSFSAYNSGTLQSTIAVVGGGLKLTNTGTNSYAFATFSWAAEVGQVYRVSCDLKNGNASYAHFKPHSGGLWQPSDHTHSGTSYESTTHTVTATSTTCQLRLQLVGGNGTYVHFDNISVTKAEHDRSVGNESIKVFGTVTKTAVATGADLVAYSGFSTSNYLQQPYNSDLNVTNEFSISFWVKDWQSGQDLLHRGPGGTRNSKTSYYMYCDGGYDYRLTLTSNGSSEQIFEIPLAGNLTGWQKVCFTLKPGGVVEGYLNGKLEFTGAFTGTNIFTQATDQNGLYIGHGPVSAAFGGSLALLRISATAPTEEQIKKMYNDEKHLFTTNAKATLYGTSDAVTALAYDDDTELLHVGTPAGRSDFQGLRRINNTTRAIGTAISAVDGFIVEE